MVLFDDLDKRELKELIIKCWMTHDGSWFYSCLKEFGVEKANKLNKAAIKLLSNVEMQRIKKALGKAHEKIKTFEQLKEFIDDAFSVIKGDFMNFNYTFPSKNRLHWEMTRCFAHEGMEKMGVSDQYQCGLLYRVGCWLDAIGTNYKIDPSIDTCLLNSREKCSGDIIFYF